MNYAYEKSIALDYLLKILLHKIIINYLYRYEPVLLFYLSVSSHSIDDTFEIISLIPKLVDSLL